MVSAARQATSRWARSAALSLQRSWQPGCLRRHGELYLLGGVDVASRQLTAAGYDPNSIYKHVAEFTDGFAFYSFVVRAVVVSGQAI